MTPAKKEVVEAAAGAGSVWTVYGISNWTEAAGFLAFVYTALLILRFLWKYTVRPFLVAHGWLRPKPGDFADTEPGRLP